MENSEAVVVTSEQNTNLTVDEHGNGKFLGMQVSLAEILGDTFVTTWMANITEQDIALVMEKIDNLVYTTNANDEKFFKYEEEVDSGGYSYHKRTEETPVWKAIQAKFREKYVDCIMQKINERFKSDEYQKRAEEIADELVDFATNGYLSIMKQRILERMLGNVLNPKPSFDQKSIEDMVADEVSCYAPHQNSNGTGTY